MNALVLVLLAVIVPLLGLVFICNDILSELRKQTKLGESMLKYYEHPIGYVREEKLNG